MNVAKKSAASKPTERTDLPVNVRMAVLTEAGYRCAVPTCRTILALDLHHIWEVSEHGSDDLSNLIALCPNDHRLYHNGTIKRESVQAWKGMLVALNAAFDRDSVDLLLFLDAVAGEFMVSLDGILRFTRLIAGGVVTVKKDSHWGENGPLTYSVRLSPRGKLLVAAWKKGDREAVRHVLSLPGATSGEGTQVPGTQQVDAAPDRPTESDAEAS